MSKIFESILRPLLFRLPAETAHEFGLEALKIGLGTRFARDFVKKRFDTGSANSVEKFGLRFKNPVGIAAGFDKNGKVVNQLASLGFGFVEVGTVTFDPQEGNQKPRLFRLPEDHALINRLGFNNEGTARVVERLRKLRRECVLGVNIGKNKNVSNEDAVENYLKSFDLAFEVADYIAVNVSSPNTPNLRELQRADNLEELLGSLQQRNKELTSATKSGDSYNKSLKPLLVKIAPDLTDDEIPMIVEIAQKFKLSGIIATNTTISRENLRSSLDEAGGLSGAPLRKRSNEVISKIYRSSNGELPVIGVGGVFTAEDAFDKIASGACLIQAYTGFVYKGPAFAREINSGLNRILSEKGFSDIEAAIGASTK